MAIPLLRLCKRNLNKHDRLLILVESETTKKIIEHAIYIEKSVEILIIGKIWSGSTFGVIKLASRLRRFKPTVFLLPHATNRIAISIFTLIVRADKTVLPYSKLNQFLFGKTAKIKMQHRVNYYLGFGKLGGLSDDKKYKINISIPNKYLTEVKKIWENHKRKSKRLGFAPGSGNIEANKRWPIKFYKNLGKRLLKDNHEIDIALFGSPSEKEMICEIEKSLKDYHARVMSFVDPNIMIAAGAISKCDCLLSACSGLAHIAASVGTPVVGLYGPTNPGFTGPFIKKVRIVRVGLECSPCYRLGFNKGCGNPVCMSMISVERVEKEIILALKGEFSGLNTWYQTTDAVEPDINNKSIEP